MSLLVPLQHRYFYVAFLLVVEPMLASVCPTHARLPPTPTPILIISSSFLPTGINSYQVHIVSVNIPNTIDGLFCALDFERSLCLLASTSHCAPDTLCVNDVVYKLIKVHCGTITLVYCELSTHIAVRSSGTGPCRFLRDRKQRSNSTIASTIA